MDIVDTTESLDVEPEPQKMGICFDDLTEETFADIVKIYCDLAGGNTVDYLRMDQKRYDQRVEELYSALLEELDPEDKYTHGKHYGMRMGSKLNENSKLEFLEISRERILQEVHKAMRVIRINFHPNGPIGEEADQLSRDIDEAIVNYLMGKNLAIPLT